MSGLPHLLAKAALAVLSTLLAVGLPAPALAQYGQYPSAPSRPPDVPRSQEAEPTEPTPLAELHRAANCLVERDAIAAERLLVTAHASDEERREATRLLRAAQRCLRARDPILTSASLFRGALAEALYEARFQAAPSVATVVAVAGAPLGNDAASLAPAVSLAECSVAARPDAVRTLLSSDPAGAAEQQAFQALSSSFSSCLRAGTTLDADRATIRGLLAESLYRWSIVQRDGAGSPWALSTGSPR